MAIEIVDFPKKMVIFYSYVKLPEGIAMAIILITVVISMGLYIL